MEPAVIIGIDESGNGALAGPLLVAAAAFPYSSSPVRAIYRGVRGDRELVVTDSKAVRHAEHREVLATAVRQQALAIAVIERTSKEIDDYLIHNVQAEAIKLAASRVIERLAPRFPDPANFVVLLDGDIPIPRGIPCPVRTVAHGDALVWQIGAASILAKTARDARMVHFAEKYPRYGFDRHKGYPVPDHKDRLRTYGPCAIHRVTYQPVSAFFPTGLGFEE